MLSSRSESFIGRHLGPREHDIATMTKSLGYTSLDELCSAIIPESIRLDRELDLPEPVGEPRAFELLAELASRNQPSRSFIGMGYYGTHLPSVIQRNLLENPGWYTAYTPYQAEVSQGRLEALLNFQQMVVDLTGLDTANASLLDEATAAAEAMTMARRVNKSSSNRFLVENSCHPQTIAVLETRSQSLGIEIVHVDDSRDADEEEIFGGIVQYPHTLGTISDIRERVDIVKSRGGLAIVATDLLALCLLTPPGEFGADIAIGSAQRFGVPMGYGGPHAAFFATKEKHRRSIPGRLIGVAVDAQGKTAFRMALQTREQHIRREKATSNICTAQVLLAVIAGMYAVYHGPDGLRRRAEDVHSIACGFADGLKRAEIEPAFHEFFDTVTLSVPGKAQEIHHNAAQGAIDLRLIDDDHVAVSFDETSTPDDLVDLLSIITESNWSLSEVGILVATEETKIPQRLQRQSGYLDHPIFHSIRSETQMMRYLRRLQAKDIALDRSMIPLGSCTMKLNAATEMMAVTWPEFANVHPFVPTERASGFQTMIGDLERWLAEITGFDAVSMQPNAGSQGEYTGLLAIRSFHRDRGQSQRDVCLIPASAHGTNPASAVMAGMRVLVVACDRAGNIDHEDLKTKAAAHSDRLAALMITYPSTHGVFEDRIEEVCTVVHDHGGQVYLDGANLNAMLGLCRPGDIGADVSHINLHKTFCIPHGGGGPGMGPIGVKAHLTPYLPGHPVIDVAGTSDKSMGTVSAGPWGSPLILPVSWAYVAMMGADGLKQCSKIAILNANYVAHRLQPHFPIVFKSEAGFVAHECIIDFRHIKEETGITAEDVAKRLVDFGFHAPTMSWPVPETMMIEPTESESKDELDRFCDAMITIRREIRDIETGGADRSNNLLKNAPHVHELLFDSWDRPYSRSKAYFPLNNHGDKYWPPVARIDNAYGDRNLFCTCPPIEGFMDQEAEETP